MSLEKINRRKFLSRLIAGSAGTLFLPSLSQTGFSKTFPSLKTNREQSRIFVERAFFTMGTIVTISAYGEDEARVHHAVAKAFHAIQEVDDLMSVYKEDSEVSMLNAAAGQEMIRVHTSIIRILSYAKSFSSFTSGSFDITIEPLMQLWGFRNQTKVLSRIPTDREIRQTLDTIGSQNIFIDEKENRVGFLHPNSRIDLGGIAVGYSVDRAVNVLHDEGIESAFINHSGDAFALGSPPDSDGWNIAIPHPQNPDDVIESFTLRDKAVSTSGNYHSYTECQSKRFGHILDPHRGIPGEGMLSATIIADSSIEADALATGLFCMGKEKLEEAMRHLPGTDVFSVYADGDSIGTTWIKNV